MSDEKISAMPNAAALTGAELVPIVQGGANVKSTTNAISQQALPSQITSPSDGQVLVFNGGASKWENDQRIIGAPSPSAVTNGSVVTITGGLGGLTSGFGGNVNITGGYGFKGGSIYLRGGLVPPGGVGIGGQVGDVHIYAAKAPAGNTYTGGNIFLYSGDNNGPGPGGVMQIYGGYAHGGGTGGHILMTAGGASGGNGNGGDLKLQAGQAYSGNGSGGLFEIYGGNGHGSGAGGPIKIIAGYGIGTGRGGDLVMVGGAGTPNGNIIMKSAGWTMPTSAVGLPSGALWNNLGVVNIAP